jgi:flagellar basal-body rod protein FlgG
MTAISALRNIAATGMLAQQFNVDVISNNIANSHTNGYRKVRAEFADVVNNAMANNENDPTMAVAGVDVVASHQILTAGSLVQTNGSTNLSVIGDGFFQVSLPDGTTGYTRDGALSLDGSGKLVTSSGLVLLPQLTINGTMDSIQISATGQVSVTNKGTTTAVGQLSLARFANPEGLESVGDNLFIATENSGAITTGNPGTSGLGTLQSNATELSNVDIAEEMTNLISAQRAYQLSARAFQIADDMAGISNEIPS